MWPELDLSGKKVLSSGEQINGAKSVPSIEKQSNWDKFAIGRMLKKFFLSLASPCPPELNPFLSGSPFQSINPENDQLFALLQLLDYKLASEARIESISEMKLVNFGQEINLKCLGAQTKITIQMCFDGRQKDIFDKEDL